MTALIFVSWRRNVARVEFAPIAGDRFSAALTRLVRRGTEIMSETLMAGHAAESKLHRRTSSEIAADVAMYKRREDEWNDEVEELLVDHPDLRRFSEAHGIPATGHYVIHNRVEDRLRVLREIRDGR